MLRLAAAQLDRVQRETIYQDEWLPELTYILRGKESRPITRLIYGLAYATGILISARRVAQRLDRRQAGPPASSTNMSTRESTYYAHAQEALRLLGQHDHWVAQSPLDDKEAVLYGRPKVAEFYDSWKPKAEADGGRGAVVWHFKSWRGRPMKWPPSDQSGT